MIEVDAELLVKATAIIDSFIRLERHRIRESGGSSKELESYLTVLSQLLNVLRSKGIL